MAKAKSKASSKANSPNNRNKLNARQYGQRIRAIKKYLKEANVRLGEALLLLADTHINTYWPHTKWLTFSGFLAEFSSDDGLSVTTLVTYVNSVVRLRRFNYTDHEMHMLLSNVSGSELQHAVPHIKTQIPMKDLIREIRTGKYKRRSRTNIPGQHCWAFSLNDDDHKKFTDHLLAYGLVQGDKKNMKLNQAMHNFIDDL